ncbi:MAG: heme ABC transporter permease [Proteobacteria bacterium]|nr:heme ABC transporter permease [Pseudomonadota bacterium]
MWHRFANPHRFLIWAAQVQPWLGWGAAGLLASGAWLALAASPADYQQGETVRIMYVHVPAAWLGMACYAAMAAASAALLIWRHPLAGIAARATAPVGTCFTALALVTGALWGQPMWGTWWVWDARLTSMLVLLFLYLGYLALQGAFDDPARGQKAAAILALTGVVNLPIIKFSVDWWNTLHQPASVIRLDGPAIDPAMLRPLLVMAAGYTVLYLWLVCVLMRTELVAARVRAAQMRIAEQHTLPAESSARGSPA